MIISSDQRPHDGGRELRENCDLRNVNVSCFEGDCLIKFFDELIHLVVTVFAELVNVVAVSISMNVAVVAAVGFDETD